MNAGGGCDIAPFDQAVGVTQQDEGNESYSQHWSNTQDFAGESGAVLEYDPEYAGQSATEEAGAFTLDEGRWGLRVSGRRFSAREWWPPAYRNTP